MTQPDLSQTLRRDLLDFLTETFEQVKGIYLDKNTSLFETLATISAEDASKPVSASCATLAAQVAHVRFYIDVLEQYLRDQPPEKVDWGEIWRTVSTVTPEEWAASQAQLRASYDRVRALVESFERIDGDHFGNTLAIIVHSCLSPRRNPASAVHDPAALNGQLSKFSANIDAISTYRSLSSAD